jgi:hypothetical protein
MRTFALLLLLSAAIHVQAQTPRFKVIAFYNGTWDAAHISFVKEANQWFPAIAAQYNFSYESTTNWNNLNASFLSQYQVVLFLDDAPTGTSQRAAFQQYMQNGGAFMGFHVSAFTTAAGEWSWYHNTFLGTGNFRNNTWGPTTATLRVEDPTHPSTLRLPSTFTSAVSEWYSWTNDLRNNSNIRILTSVDPVSFPLGTDPNQSWTSGYYPIMWTNRNFKMLYANFGHNDMNYSNNTPKSSTFGSEIQNRFIIDGLLWLGGVDAGPGPAVPIGQVITLRAGNGLYVSGENGTKPMICDRPAPQTWEQFSVLDAGNGKIHLRSMGKYVSSENGTKAMTCNRLTPASYETFDWIKNTDGTISLRGSNGMYVSSENGEQAMNCNRPAIQGWEKFTFSVVGPVPAAAQLSLSQPVEEDAAETVVYPNPFSTQLNYTLPGKYAAHVATVYDLSGRQLLRTEFRNRQSTYSLDASRLPRGLYILDISSGAYHKRVKVQKTQ